MELPKAILMSIIYFIIQQIEHRKIENEGFT